MQLFVAVITISTMKEEVTSTLQTPQPPPTPPKRIDDARSRSYASSSSHTSSSPSWTSPPKLLELGLGLADEFNLRTTSYIVRRVLSDEDISWTTASFFNQDRNDDEHSLNNGVVASRVKGTYAGGGVETVLTKKRRSTIIPKDKDLNPRPPPGSPTSVIHDLRSPQQHDEPQQHEPISRVIARVDTIVSVTNEVPEEGAETILDEEMYDIMSSIERSINDTTVDDLRHFGLMMNRNSEPLSSICDLESGNNHCTQIDLGGVESTKVDQHHNHLSLVSGHVTALTKKLGKESNTGKVDDKFSAIATIDSGSKVSSITNQMENDTDETRRKSWFDRNRLLLFAMLVMSIGVGSVGGYLFRKEKQNQKSVEVRNYSSTP
jgi:hypothetical protein